MPKSKTTSKPRKTAKAKTHNLETDGPILLMLSNGQQIGLSASDAEGRSVLVIDPWVSLRPAVLRIPLPAGRRPA